jgi:hypothetical protein
VIADWLWISVQTGEKKSFQPYLIPKSQSVKNNPPLFPEKEKPGEISDHYRNREARLHGEGLDRRPGKSHIKAYRDTNTPPPQVHLYDNRDGDKTNVIPPQESRVYDDDILQGMSKHSSANPSRSLSKSPSPSKEQVLIPTLPIARHELSTNNPKVSGPSTSLDMAISELLKKKRAGPRAVSVERPDCRRQIKRRPLIGRANSQSSSRAAAAAGGAAIQQKEISRASSIDTLNEDGYGSVVDGLDSPSKHANSNAPSFASIPTEGKTNKTEAQQLLESRLDPFHNLLTHHDLVASDGGCFDEEATPPMTQLGYEDADAIAMREKITNRVRQTKSIEGKPTTGKPKDIGPVVIGKLKDHEVLEGWGNGRRTRRLSKNVLAERL